MNVSVSSYCSRGGSIFLASVLLLTAANSNLLCPCCASSSKAFATISCASWAWMRIPWNLKALNPVHACRSTGAVPFLGSQIMKWIIRTADVMTS